MALWAAAGLAYIAEAAIDIANNEGMTEVITTAVSESIETILFMNTLEGSPLMTPSCLEVLKKCNATSQARSKIISHKANLLNEAGTDYKRAADQVLVQQKVMSILSALDHGQNKSCDGKFECYFGDQGNRLFCRIFHKKQ